MLLSIDLENCYGINKMTKDFILENRPIVIHSSNGVMKTSFTKTIDDIINGNETVDKVYPEKITKRNIKIDNVNVTSKDFKVFYSYSAKKTNDQLTTLILSEILKKEYLDIVDSESVKIEELFDKIGVSLGIKKNRIVETKKIFKNVFKKDTDIQNLFKCNTYQKNSISDIYKEYGYEELFNDSVKKAINNDVKDQLVKYHQKYNRLIKKSSIFTSGLFDLTNLNNIKATLITENYFKANHKLQFNNYNSLIETEEQLSDFIDEQMSLISNNEEVKKLYNLVEKSINSNKKTRVVLELIKRNYRLATEYKDIESFERKYLALKLIDLRNEINNLRNLHNKNRSMVKQIFKKAEKERTLWDKTIEDFHKRFNVPFQIELSNRRNVVMGIDEPNLIFKYDNNIVIDEEVLRDQVLSEGEKRALYSLQILFEIEKIKLSNDNKILVFDDIADSYDYTNKLAIVEMINEISDSSHIKCIVLTHNFDFYRTIGLRISKHSNSYFALRDYNKVTIDQGTYLKDVFREFKDKINGSIRALIAIIPFSRNLIEYTSDNYISNSKYLIYTRAVHYRTNGASVTVNQIVNEINEQYQKNFTLRNPKRFYQAVIDEANQIATETQINQNLEDKLVLAIALRIKAEKYMYKKLRRKGISVDLNSSHKLIGTLKKLYIQHFPRQTKILDIINSIVLLTPPHIHVNNFMYEPMMDYSIDRLRKLYNGFLNEVRKF